MSVSVSVFPTRSVEFLGNDIFRFAVRNVSGLIILIETSRRRIIFFMRFNSVVQSCLLLIVKAAVSFCSVAGFTIKADVWSFGITMYELATGTFPYKEWENVFQQLSDVVDGPAPRLPEHNTRLSRAFRDFVDSCLTKEARQRPKFEELLDSTFMQPYKLPAYGDAAYKQHSLVRQLASFVGQVLDDSATNAKPNGHADGVEVFV